MRKTWRDMLPALFAAAILNLAMGWFVNQMPWFQAWTYFQCVCLCVALRWCVKPPDAEARK